MLFSVYICVHARFMSKIFYFVRYRFDFSSEGNKFSEQYKNPVTFTSFEFCFAKLRLNFKLWNQGGLQHLFQINYLSRLKLRKFHRFQQDYERANMNLNFTFLIFESKLWTQLLSINTCFQWLKYIFLKGSDDHM